MGRYTRTGGEGAHDHVRWIRRSVTKGVMCVADCWRRRCTMSAHACNSMSILKYEAHFMQINRWHSTSQTDVTVILFSGLPTQTHTQPLRWKVTDISNICSILWWSKPTESVSQFYWLSVYFRSDICDQFPCASLSAVLYPLSAQLDSSLFILNGVSLSFHTHTQTERRNSQPNLSLTHSHTHSRVFLFPKLVFPYC